MERASQYQLYRRLGGLRANLVAVEKKNLALIFQLSNLVAMLTEVAQLTLL
jgi:hypothetical protein